MSGSTATDTATIFMELVVLTASGAVLADLARRLGQPAVIGEIVAGIALGPTLLGRLPGHLTERLFPSADRPFLAVLANLGLVLFMCAIGYDLGHRNLRLIRSASVVSLGSIVVPFALGAGLGLLLYPQAQSAADHRPGHLAFVLFIGVAVSITAFPVLARILSDLHLHRSRVGTFAMASAAGADVAAWAILALVVAIATGGSLVHAFVIIGEMAAFVIVLAFVVRPLLRWVLGTRAVARSNGRLSLLIVFTGLLLSAWVTTRLGFQPIFGGFAFGAAMPAAAVQAAAPEVPLLIEQAGQLLVPVFFVTTGLSVDLSDLGTRGYLLALLVIATACVGKFLGSAGTATLTGFDLRRASAVGVLMNSRGLTELIAIQVGVTLGILNERLSSIFVLMAIFTTVITAPLFRVLYQDRLRGEDQPRDADRPGGGNNQGRPRIAGPAEVPPQPRTTISRPAI